MTNRQRRLLLIGGGHSHIEVLRQFALQPEPGMGLTLISPDAAMAYSGMLPGLVAGHYTVADSHIPLAPLCSSAGATFIAQRAVALDLPARTVTLDSGMVVAFDVASIDIGSLPDTDVPGSRRYAIAVKPVSAFLSAWQTILDDAQCGTLHSLAVVGGGAGGIELVLAMAHRLQHALRGPSLRVALISDALNVPHAVRRHLTALLAARRIEMHVGSAVAVDEGKVELQSGKVIAAERIAWATSASPAAWLAASGLACDSRGFVRVNDFLRSPSHDFIFAAGDCASQDNHPRPKSGVFAVRQGPPLAKNVRRALQGLQLTRFIPQRRGLALISTGNKNAIAAYGRFAVSGAWVWRWKDRIDRGFISKYRAFE